MIDIVKAKVRLQEISKKNDKREYSLGDVLLLEKYEKELKQAGYTQLEIESFSPSYYKVC